MNRGGNHDRQSAEGSAEDGQETALKLWREFSNPEKRDRILSDLNRSTLDDVGPVGEGAPGMRVLWEMNEPSEQEGRP